MDQLEDRMFSGQSVSAADREAQRRWAQAGSTQRRKKKKKLPKTSLRHAGRVPAFLLRVHGGASSSSTVCRTLQFHAETGTHSAYCAGYWRFHRFWPVVVLRQGLSSRQCRIPPRFCSSWTRLACPSSSKVLWSRCAGICGVPQ